MYVKIIPRYFIILDALVNRIISLIFFSGCSLLVYRNKTDLCVDLVSCNFAEFISYHTFLVNSFGIFYVYDM